MANVERQIMTKIWIHSTTKNDMCDQLSPTEASSEAARKGRVEEEKRKKIIPRGHMLVTFDIHCSL